MGHALNAGVDFGTPGVDLSKPRLGFGSALFEVRADRRRDILTGGGGDIGDRVGTGQRVEMELRQGDGEAA